MAAYGVGPRAIRLLRKYWGRLTMVARDGGYFGMPFKGYCGVTQGDLLFPTISNVVVDAIICYWVAVAKPTGDGTEGLGLSIQDLAVYFYADDGLVASTHPQRLQRAFVVLNGLFDRVGLRTSTRNTVSMACQICHAPGQMSLEAYGRRTTGTGPTFQGWQRQRVA